MINPFVIGDKQTFVKRVETTDTAVFDAGQVHPVYATFALGKDAEWVCRLFVLQMKADDEEGIGTFLNVQHKSPALVGQTVTFEATLMQINNNEIICDFIAKVDERIIAVGSTGQKILKKQKLHSLFNNLR